MVCSACGAEATGNFCSSCGAPLKTKKCPGCGAEALSSARFCTGCGSAFSAQGRPGGKGAGKSGPSDPEKEGSATLAWWVAGVMMVFLLVALGYPILSKGEGGASGGAAPPGMGGGSGGSGLVDLTTMSLEEQATILFNRVMTSSSVGDTADVEFFQPKALVILEQLNPTDPDGIFHYALIHQAGGDAEAALEKAQEGLSQVPDYLLLLAVAAEASANLGDEEGARAFYGHFLEVYETEMQLMRPGYEHHQQIFPVYKDEAEAFLNRG